MGCADGAPSVKKKAQYYIQRIAGTSGEMPPSSGYMIEFDKFELLTFDCYGTLIDWETGMLNVLRPVLTERGVATDDDQIIAKTGRTNRIALS